MINLMEQKRVFIGNLGFDTTIETVVEVFSQFGTVEDSYKPFKKGFAFITFSNEAEAQAAVEKGTGLVIEGREIKVSIAKPREERPRTGFGRDYGNRGGYQNRDRGGRDRY